MSVLASLECVSLILQRVYRLCLGLALPFQNPIKTLPYQLLSTLATVSLLVSLLIRLWIQCVAHVCLNMS